MKNPTKLLGFALAAMVPLACSTTDPARIDTATGAYPDRIDGFGQPVAMGPGQRVNRVTPRVGKVTNAVGPIVINMRDVPAATRADRSVELTGPANKRSHAPGPISDEEMAELRERAKTLPPNARAPQIRSAQIGDVTAGAPLAAPGFDGPDSGDCCGGSGASVPPDPEMAAGLSHVIAAVNSAYAVYDKSGNEVIAPRTFESLFSDFPECQGTFDPNVIYDESADRYFMGIVGNGNGTHYCMAVSQSGDAAGAWNTYSVQVDVNGDFFDFPHAGVGVDAIYFGSNMFGSSFTQSIIWAVDKAAMYSGADNPAAVPASVGTNFTPQPMNIHGQAPFPASGSAHYFIANVISGGSWNGEDFAVFAWSDPFNSSPTQVGTFSLSGASPLAIDFPVDQPQSGGRRAAILDGGDWRIQDAEYSTDTGLISMAQAVSCNPGGGTVNCVRWAEINPATLSIVDIGIIASSGQYRSYPDTAINACGDIAIGYSKMSGSTFPGIWAAARENGTVGPEFELKAGETTYTSFQSWRQANRWGDYTGMTIDPDGETFWYLGEYAKNNGLSTNWGTYISSFKLDSCDSSGPGPGNTAPTVTITAPADGSSSNEGDSVSFAGTASDAEDGSLTGGLSWTSSLDGVIGSGAGFSTTSLSVGTHSVTASVSDSGSLAGSDAVSVTVNAIGGGGLTITSAIGTKQKGVKIVTLNWNGTDGSGNVTITRDGGSPVTAPDSGSYTDNTGEKGGGTYLYEICKQGTADCDSVSVVF